MSKKQKELTPEERKKILDEAPVYIEKCGINNKERAVFVSMIAKEVIGSSNNWYSSMQPRIRDHSEFDQWNMAYAIIMSFLKEHNCEETLKVIDLEFDNPANPIPRPRDLGDNYEGNTNDFDSILSYVPTETENKFSYKLNKFLQQAGDQDVVEFDDERFEDDKDAPAFLTQPKTMSQNPMSPSLSDQQKQSFDGEEGKEEGDEGKEEGDEGKEEGDEGEEDDDEMNIELIDDLPDDNTPPATPHESSSIHIESDAFDIGDDDD